MNKDPRIQQLAREAALQIKALTVAHESQIRAIYQNFRQQASNLEGSNADELHSPSVTPAQSAEIDRSNKQL